MLSIDANILFYASNARCRENAAARSWLHGQSSREDVALSEFILCELYVLLRNPTILARPMSAGEAARVVGCYRRHPRWQVQGFPSTSRNLHDQLWTLAGESSFGRRRIFDTRTALALQAFGVTEFATANVRDFADLGFARVWNPLVEAI